MDSLSASIVLLVRPSCFCCNPDTMSTNSFQCTHDDDSAEEVQMRALKEFDGMVKRLQNIGIKTVVIEDSSLLPGRIKTPDSIFPNNWFTTHTDGRLYIYPMYARNRRHERKCGALEGLTSLGYKFVTVDMSPFESMGMYLEGTGSMVFDRDNLICYAAISPRTDSRLVDLWCKEMMYTPITFVANRENGEALYHTNVMMSVGPWWVVCCVEIINPTTKDKVLSAIEKSGKRLITITEDQLNKFCGNILSLRNHDTKEIFTVMSKSAYEAFTAEQRRLLEPIVEMSIDTIERHGGGSTRCMLAEIFLPNKESVM